MKFPTAIAAMLACACIVARAQSPAPPTVIETKCALCHGQHGESASEEYPRLAAQHEAYLAKQLRDFRDGRREGIMSRMAKGLSDEDIAAIAHFFAAQPAPPSPDIRQDLAAVGRFVYQRGNPWTGIPACKVCHGEAAHGTPQLPRLAGQNSAYLERQIRDFTQRKRTNDNEVMHAVAGKITELELHGVAEYLAGAP